MSKGYTFLGTLVLSSVLCACQEESDADADIRTLSIDSNRFPCVSIFQHLCLLVEENASGDSNLFYNTINGFQFTWGHRYELSVQVSELENPPADASSLVYELIDILSDKEDAIGTLYTYDNVELLGNTFSFDDGFYHFLGKTFQCADETNCNQLLAINSSGGFVNLQFEYIEQGNIRLIRWN